MSRFLTVTPQGTTDSLCVNLDHVTDVRASIGTSNAEFHFTNNTTLIVEEQFVDVQFQIAPGDAE